jgi:tripartite-type tricarboxylate transporter receptor subunit TctC
MISRLSRSIPLVLLARKMMPAEDLKELIAWLKGNPNKASAGVVTASERLETLMFQKEIGTRFALVPYRGSALSAQDLAAGQIDLFFDTPVQLPLVRAGSIKARRPSYDELPGAPVPLIRCET